MGYACSKCGEKIPLEDFEDGSAVYAEGKSYCAKCVRDLLPMLKALQQIEDEESRASQAVEAKHQIRHSANEYFPTHSQAEPKKFSGALVMVAIGAVLVFVIGIAIALSGNGQTRNPDSNRQREAQYANRDKETYESRNYTGNQPRERDNNYDAAKKAYDILVSEIDALPREYARNISKLEEFKKVRKVPSTLAAKLEDKIRGIEQAWGHAAQKELDIFLAKAKELKDEYKYEKAIEHLDKFPDGMLKAGNVTDEMEKEKKNLREMKASKSKFMALLKEANAMLGKGDYAGVVKKLSGQTECKAAPADSVKEAGEILTKAQAEIAKIEERKKAELAEKKRKEEEANREYEKKLAEVKESRPLHYLDWTESPPEFTGRYEVSTGTHSKLGKNYRLVYSGIKGAELSFKCKFSIKPEIALLRIIHSGRKLASASNPAKFLLIINGKEGRIEETVPFEEANRDIDISSVIQEGENTIIIRITDISSDYLLSKMEIRAYLPEDQMKKERSRVRAEARKLVAEAKKERKSRNNKAAKKQAQWPPAIVAGKNVTIFNGKNLSSWKPVRGTWTVRDGMIIGTSGGQRSYLVTDFAGQNAWKNYEVNIEFVLVKGKIYYGVHGTIENNGQIKGSEVNIDFEANKLIKLVVGVENNQMYLSINGGSKLQGDQKTKHLQGGFYFCEEPNTEIHIRSVSFTLKP